MLVSEPKIEALYCLPFEGSRSEGRPLVWAPCEKKNLFPNCVFRYYTESGYKSDLYMVTGMPQLVIRMGKEEWDVPNATFSFAL